MQKIGLIGTGFIGKTHAKAFQQIPDAKLAAIVQPDPEERKKQEKVYSCTFYTSAEEMLEKSDIDIVDICVPTYLHADMVKLAASYGKHIICEKPFALSSVTADEMIAAVKKAHVQLLIAQVLRFWPEYAKIKGMYSKGLLGDGPKLITGCRLSQYPNWSTWFQDTSKSGGGLYDLLLHDIDFSCFLSGNVDSVFAAGYQSKTGGWDHVLAILSFQNGDKAMLEGSDLMPDGYPFTMRMKVSGREAVLDWNYIGGFNVEGRDKARKSLYFYKMHEKPELLRVTDRDPYLIELEYFIRCMEQGREIDILPLEEERKVLRVMEAVRTSLESGRMVTL